MPALCYFLSRLVARSMLSPAFSICCPAQATALRVARRDPGSGRLRCTDQAGHAHRKSDALVVLLVLVVLADFMPNDAADDRTADSAGRAAARENGTSDSTSTGADRGALVLPRHPGTTTQPEEQGCGNDTQLDFLVRHHGESPFVKFWPASQPSTILRPDSYRTCMDYRKRHPRRTSDPIANLRRTFPSWAVQDARPCPTTAVPARRFAALFKVDPMQNGRRSRGRHLQAPSRTTGCR